MVEEKPIEEDCDKCGAPMVVKTGRFGKFLACSNYPECKNTKKILVNGEGKLEVAQEETSSEVCEKCGAPMVIKTGRFGKFLACSNYPECKNTKKIGRPANEERGRRRSGPDRERTAKNAGPPWCTGRAASAPSSPAAITPSAAHQKSSRTSEGRRRRRGRQSRRTNQNRKMEQVRKKKRKGAKRIWMHEPQKVRNEHGHRAKAIMK